MNLTDFYRLIGAPDANAGATEENIIAAESRLGGRLPDALRGWFRLGEAEMCVWRFRSLESLYTINEVFPAVRDISISGQKHSSRQMPARDYVIFCDALIYLPFYDVNIRPGGPHFGDVVSAIEERCAEAEFVSATFGEFAEFLFQHPDDAFQYPAG